MNHPADTTVANTQRTLGVVRVAARGLYRSRLPQMAAALAYRTIFGVIPVLIVTMVVVQYFVEDETITDWVERGLAFSGISAIVIDPPADLQEQNGAAGPETESNEPPGEPDGPPSGPPPDESPATFADDQPDTEIDPSPGAAQDDLSQSGRLDGWVVAAVDGVRSIHFRTIGFVGVLLLIYAAVSMLVEIERTFNQVYHAPRGRSWPRRIITYWTLLTLGSILLCATFIVGDQFKEWVTGLAQAQGIGVSSPLAITFAGFALTVLISTILLWLVYVTVPTARVHLRAALAGAFVAAVLWEAGKWGFTNYLIFSASSKYARLYGSIALIPLFLLWVYLTWLIVLFGLQVSYGIQMLGSWRELIADGDDGEQIVDPLVVVPVMAHIADRFAHGRPSEMTEIAEQIGLPETLIGRILDLMIAASLLNRVESDGEVSAFALARPPSEIHLRDLFAVGRDLTARTEPGTCEKVLERLRQAQLTEAGDLPLSSLLADTPAPPGEDA